MSDVEIIAGVAFVWFVGLLGAGAAIAVLIAGRKPSDLTKALDGLSQRRAETLKAIGGYIENARSDHED